MRTIKVKVLPYDKNWKADFEKIKSEIENAIGKMIITVEHVGSTSVEGMSAKPCIDIDVVIKDYSVFDNVVSHLADIGYIYEGDLGIKDRHAFKYSDKNHLQTHHLYVCPWHSRELHRLQLGCFLMILINIWNTNPVVSRNYIHFADWNNNVKIKTDL